MDSKMAFQQTLYNKSINKEKCCEMLDDSQRKAVEAQKEGAKIVIQAPAGSGKTHTLITAITAYRYENINDRICAITYTRAARAEMEQRLQQNGVYDVDVTTIHVWSRNLLEQFAKRYDFKISLLQERDIKIILKDLVDYYKQMRNKPYLKVNIDILYSFIMGNKNMDITDSYRHLLKTLENLYLDYKEINTLYDFTDYPKYLYDILVAYNESIKGIDALFVDEFQDVDPVQLQLFEKVENCNQKFFIGDPWQSIFVFRGADGEAFEKLKRQKEFEIYKLNRNYRSYQGIVDYASNVYKIGRSAIENNRSLMITDVLERKPSLINCVNGEGGSVFVENSKNHCFLDVVNNNKSQIELQKAFNFMMRENSIILCRSNKQVKEIEKFGHMNTTTIHQAKGLEYDNVIIVDLFIDNSEELNIAYVGLTRAKKNMMVLDFGTLWLLMKKWNKEKQIENIL